MIVGHTRAERLALTEAFRGEGYAVEYFADVALAMLALGRRSPDAVLIDWRPETLAFIERHGGLVPVLVLSRHGALLDVVRSFKAGAADYLRQPCYFPEILARVERARSTARVEERLSLGSLSLDVASGVAHIDGVSVPMTEREARMLAALIRCPEQPVAREALLRVAGITRAKPTIVESYIKQLRQRHALLRRCVRTRYGRGYVFCREA